MTTATIGRPATARTSVPRKTAAPRTSGRQQASAHTSVPRKATAPRASSQPRADAEVATGPDRGRPVGHALLAAERAMRRNSLHLQLPVVGELHLPAAEEVAFIGGVAALAIVGVLEWPVAVLLALGHALAANRRNKVVRSLGEALEEV